MQLKKKKLKRIFTPQLTQIFGGIINDGDQPIKMRAQNPAPYLKALASRWRTA